MKILHVIPSVAEIRGGTSRAVLDMINALRIQDFDATIVTTNENGRDSLDVILGQRINYQQVPIYFFERFSSAVGFVQDFTFSWPLTRWLWQHIDDYDLLHVHAVFSYVSTIAMAIARAKKVPYIVTPHGLLCKWSLQQSTYKKRIYLLIIERANLNHARALHFTMPLEQQEVESLGLNTAGSIIPLGLAIPQLIPNARQRLRQQLNIPQDEPVILFMSRLHPKKGLDYLISALGYLKDQQFTLVIAGSGEPDYEQEIQKLLTAAEINERTHRVGFVCGEQKDILLQGSDLFVLPSFSENFGIVVLEALASGIPVLITPGVALSDVVTQNQLGYVVELDSSAIAQKIRHFLQNNIKTNEFSSSIRQFVLEHYSWTQISSQLINFYQSALR